MIKSFAHKGLERFFLTGDKSGIQPAHANKLILQLATINQAVSIEDIDVPGWRLHPLKGEMKKFWSIVVNANWRLTFAFDGQDFELINYQDYH